MTATATKPRILVCDDEKNMRYLISDLLEDQGWEPETFGDGSEVLPILEENGESFPVMIVDLTMPQVDGFTVIKAARDLKLKTSIIVLTAYGTVDTAVKAMQAGADDFIVKPFENSHLISRVRRALESRELMAQAEMSHPQFTGADDSPLPIIGNDRRLQSIFDIVERIADIKTSVLIQGESGTGKELVAQAIHFNGDRRDKPFVAVNCGALPEALLESEFFGHERGAFTGAHALQRGKFEIADGGTLFLDEVGEMPLNLQVKLLRVLQEGRFTRVGGEREIESDVRIIAATNRDLARETELKTFREDLYYRLNVIPIYLPPLRERKGDIPALVRFFHDRATERHRLPKLTLDEPVMDGVMKHAWPGNIRELQNAVEKAVILQDTRHISVLAASHFAARTSTNTPTDGILTPPPVDTVSPEEGAEEHQALIDLGEDPTSIRPLSQVSADAQRAALIRAIKICKGNKAEAAKRLGVSYKTLFNRIHELNISISTNIE